MKDLEQLQAEAVLKGLSDKWNLAKGWSCTKCDTALLINQDCDLKCPKCNRHWNRGAVQFGDVLDTEKL